jgi:hypothetical protein
MDADRLPGAAPPRALTATADPYAQWWDYAQQIARTLWAGIPLPSINVYGPVLDAGERAYLSSEATYSRYTAGNASYHPVNFVVLGRLAVTAAALAVQGAVNHRRKTAARRAAAPAWRGGREVHVVLTNERLLANTTSGWTAFWHTTIREFYVDLQYWTMTVGFGHQYSPVSFTGPCVPAISVVTAQRLYGDQWSADPRLTPLLD